MDGRFVLAGRWGGSDPSEALSVSAYEAAQILLLDLSTQVRNLALELKGQEGRMGGTIMVLSRQILGPGP